MTRLRWCGGVMGWACVGAMGCAWLVFVHGESIGLAVAHAGWRIATAGGARPLLTETEIRAMAVDIVTEETLKLVAAPTVPAQPVRLTKARR